MGQKDPLQILMYEKYFDLPKVKAYHFYLEDGANLRKI